MVGKMIVLVAVAVAAMGGTATAVSPSPQVVSQQDKDFLVQAHQSNLTEIDAGKTAEEKTEETKGRKSAKTVRELGKLFIADHEKLDMAVRRVAERLDIELPGEPTAAQREQLTEVAAKSGAEFDRAWISAQLAGHRETLAAVEQEIESGSSPKVKKLATKAKPVVQEHIDLLVRAEETAGTSSEN